MSLYSNLLTVLTPYANKIKQNEIDIRTAMSLSGGAPIVVGSMSAMTDTDQIYVLSTDSKWYYYNLTSSAWVAGGVYGGVSTDRTLTQSGMSADAGVVGNKIDDLSAIMDRWNLFDVSITTDGLRLKTDGVTLADETCFVTDYIPVVVGITYEKNSPIINAYHRMSTYDASNNFVRTIGDSNSVTIESGESYIRFCGLLTEKSTTAFYVSAESSAVDSIARTDIDCITKEYSFDENKIVFPAPDGRYSDSSLGNYVSATKNKNVISLNATYQSDSHKLTLTGSKLLDTTKSSANLAYDSFPNAYVDEIPSFKLGHLYKIKLDVIEGTYTLDNPNMNYAYLIMKDKNGVLPNGLTYPNGSVFYASTLPQAVLLGIRKATYACKIAVNIIDITDEIISNVTMCNNLFQIFDKITSIGDSLMCGYTSATSTLVPSVTAKERGANWISYFGSDIGRDITNLAVGGSSWKDWRNGTGNTDISATNIDTNAYLVALGVNDSRQGLAVGTSADIAEDKANNADSVYGNMDYVLRTLHGYNPNAHIFLFTIPHSETNKADINAAIRYISEIYDYVECVDLDSIYKNDFTYGEINLTLYGTHYNPLGYRIVANYIKHALESYMISHYEKFRRVPYEF